MTHEERRELRINLGVTPVSGNVDSTWIVTELADQDAKIGTVERYHDSVLTCRELIDLCVLDLTMLQVVTDMLYVEVLV